ncbi:TonB-dependent receptor [Maribacter sp. HTCC2170]|uniref:TonB-dependent receptor n=1 Tax=Maribacter sp. (strain HTCC2170 / KCCM 42371) TaxID=313603 RepID=UPI00006BD573|nr:TonB-dependent receptor [Maribacter sp. HTCC2170]EAR02558.1 TonB-dependent outer membrane receptor [Maribacter sp. HTCC2170]
MKNLFSIFIISILESVFWNANAQTGNISGSITDNGSALAFATVQLKSKTINFGGITEENGNYAFIDVPFGEYTFRVSAIGYKTVFKKIDFKSEKLKININLETDILNLEQVVVTGTRTDKRRVDSPVIVNLINSETLDKVVATNLSEGLRFQPGLRVETDCQTCNYTQLRMNGLQGGYSQILINGRPIFSPLTGLYGLEQIPVNMIERIEVVRGGVSALYGSSAIGGTVNVLTKIPKKNDYNISYSYQNTKGSSDNIILGNATIVNEEGNAGATLFVNNRSREAYDDNDDNFSELPLLRNNSFGANMFFLPSENEKLDASFSSLNEYRYGGELIDNAAHTAQQAEERTHNVLMGNLDYQLNFNENQNSLIFYYGWQNTKRDHYTGIQPDNPEELTAFLANAPYGTSNVTTHQGGTQYNHRFNEFLNGSLVLTSGLEYVYDDVLDVISAYNYKIDQTTRNFAGFLQNDWDITPKLNFLSGFRIDKHNFVDNAVVSPRLSLLYKPNNTTQYRIGWGTGFRAPQAFDTDLHIAFAAGGISRISLSNDLKEERSNSLTTSINFDKATEHFIAGFTLEGFYTKLNDAFYLEPIGSDTFGERFEKRNGSGATVKGFTFEARSNFDYILSLDAGFTYQSSTYDKAVENIEGLPLKKEFLRTPNVYGFANLNYTPTKSFSASANVVHTGSMDLVHFGGVNTGQTIDVYTKTQTFTNISLRIGYTFKMKKVSSGIELFGGVKNITNAYQNDFDLGKNRDSNYIYGPNSPRTIFTGVRLKSL